MRVAKTEFLKVGLNALYYTGAHRLLASYSRGLGLIFTLHRVRPPLERTFAPNRLLEVAPAFLDAVITQVREQGIDIVGLDEARERIVAGADSHPFVCFTLDDGYRDNLEHAYPVFKKHGAPFAIYVPAAYPGGEGELWWVALERAIAAASSLEVSLDDGALVLAAGTTAEKQSAFDRVYRWLRHVDEDRQRAFIRALCARHGIDLASLCRSLIMHWDELRGLARDPLVTIGAHTDRHYALAKLARARARDELRRGGEAIEAELGVRPRHVSYPYGDAASVGRREFQLAAELGFATGVTTRKGVVYADHKHHLTALPRVSLNGDYQSLKFTELYLTGLPFVLANRFRRINAA